MMTFTRPVCKDTDIYSITQASVLLGIDRKTLRKYTENNAVRSHVNKLNGRTFYSGKSLKEFWDSTH